MEQSARKAGEVVPVVGVELGHHQANELVSPEQSAQTWVRLPELLELVDEFDWTVGGGEGTNIEHFHSHEESVESLKDFFFSGDCGAGLVNFTEFDS